MRDGKDIALLHWDLPDLRVRRLLHGCLADMGGDAMVVRQHNEMKPTGAFPPKTMGYVDMDRYAVNNMIQARDKEDAKNDMLFRFPLVAQDEDRA